MISLPPPDETRAIVVGLERYAELGADWCTPGAVSGALKFAEWLKGSSHLQASNIHLWLAPADDGDALPERTAQGLQECSYQKFRWGDFRKWAEKPRGTLTDGSFLIVYWSGHGVIFGKEGQQLLILPDASWDQMRCVSVSNMRLLFRAFGYERFEHQLWIVDACRNWLGGANDPVIEYWNVKDPSAVKQCAMFACCVGETAKIDSREGPTFTRFLIESLKAATPAVWPDFVDVTDRAAAELRAATGGSQSPTISVGEDWYGVPIFGAVRLSMLKIDTQDLYREYLIRLNFFYHSDRVRLTSSQEVDRKACDELLQQWGEGRDLFDMQQPLSKVESIWAWLAQDIVPAALLTSDAIRSDSANLELTVDAWSARFAWELLLRDHSMHAGPPLAVARGMLRRLEHEPSYSSLTRSADATTALVIDVSKVDASPDLTLERHATNELTAMLERTWGAANVRLLLDAPLDEILDTIRDTRPQILYICGPTEIDWPSRVGVIVDGRTLDQFHFLSFIQPAELLFLNCQNMAIAAPDLRRQGWKVVVAPFGLIDPSAASTFAKAFFAALTKGLVLIEALRAARERSRSAHPNSYAWGAFQCYGDPLWRLPMNS